MDKPDSAAPRLNARCSCYTGCGDDALSSQPHQHADDPCPAHPNAPMHAAAAPRQPEGPQDLSEYELTLVARGVSAPDDTARLVAEVKRRRARPSAAASLDALRRALRSASVALNVCQGYLLGLGRPNEAADADRWRGEARAALAAAPRDEHRTDCAKKRGLAVCVCASPAAAPIGAPDARLDREAFACRCGKMDWFVVEDDDGKPVYLECLSCERTAPLKARRKTPRVAPLTAAAASLEVEALRRILERSIDVLEQLWAGDPKFDTMTLKTVISEARAVLRRNGRHE